MVQILLVLKMLREGPVPLQTLRADIDYSSKSAKTIFGLLGHKNLGFSW